MENFRKVLRPGTRKTHNGRGYSVFLKVEYNDGRLSISGVEGPLPSGNCLGSCGQIDMSWEPLNTLAPGWTRESVKALLLVWKKWHLNDMQAGCQHQREMGWTKYDDHPSEPCPVCGYKYGSEWLTVEVPEDVLSFLVSLPDADKTPAWV